jgi:hypothetical protein
MITLKEALENTIMFHRHQTALNTYSAWLRDSSECKCPVCYDGFSTYNHHHATEEEKKEKHIHMQTANMLQQRYRTIIFGYGKCSYGVSEIEDFPDLKPLWKIMSELEGMTEKELDALWEESRNRWK